MTRLHHTGQLAKQLGVVLIGALCGACASAKLDPNNRAFTLYSPAPSNSALPSPSPTLASPPHPTSEPVDATSSSAAIDVSGDDQAHQGAPKPKLPSCSSLPDPKPTRTDRWVELRLRFDQGRLTIGSHEALLLRRPESTRRSLGRFMVELWIGCELIDRVRFDFPLLGGAPPQDSAARAPNFEALGHFETIVRVPNSDRATRLELMDRATDERRIFDWPLRSETLGQ